jgi:uncharacterized membrane protein
MNQGLNFITGIGVGAGLAYLLDPDKGDGRRAMARDRAAHILNTTSDAIEATARDLRNRSIGLANEVASRLTREEVADPVPAAQPGPRFDVMQEKWSPTTRWMIGLSGAALTLYGARRKGIFRTAIGIAGLGMLARGLTNIPMRRIVGVGAGRRAVNIQKTFNIAAPVEQLFEFWSNCENFPRFMSNVREVRNLGEGRSHWIVAGPKGVSVEWDVVLVEKIPNQVLAWRTVPGAPVEHAGMIRFDPSPDGTTRVDIKMSYNLPAGALGDVVASLFGADPKGEMDADLMRMKTMIETGIPPRNAAAAA